jgi:hypothetical protein
MHAIKAESLNAKSERRCDLGVIARGKRSLFGIFGPLAHPIASCRFPMKFVPACARQCWRIPIVRGKCGLREAQPLTMFVAPQPHPPLGRADRLQLAMADPTYPRQVPVEIDIFHEDAMHAMQAWFDTQEANGAPGDGTPEFLAQLEQVALEFPGCVIHPPDADNEEPPQAAGPPAVGLTDEEDTLLHRVWLAWCQTVWVRASEWEDISETSSSTSASEHSADLQFAPCSRLRSPRSD